MKEELSIFSRSLHLDFAACFPAVTPSGAGDNDNIGKLRTIARPTDLVVMLEYRLVCPLVSLPDKDTCTPRVIHSTTLSFHSLPNEIKGIKLFRSRSTLNPAQKRQTGEISTSDVGIFHLSLPAPQTEVLFSVSEEAEGQLVVGQFF